MAKYWPNGGGSDPHRVIKPQRRDHFGSGEQVAGALGVFAADHRNGGRDKPKPPPGYMTRGTGK